MASFFKFLKFYFQLYWVFIAALGLSPVAESGAPLHCGAPAAHCSGFSCCGAWVLQHAGFRSRGSPAPEHRLSSCGALA